MAFNQIYSKIFKRSIFELLPELKDVAFTEGQIKSVPADTIILAKGAVPSELIIPLDAEFKMENDQSVTFLKIGRSMALNNLLFQSPVEFEFRTTDKTRVFTLPHESLSRFLDKNPFYKKYLYNITSCPATRSFKKYLEGMNVPLDKIMRIISSIKDDSFSLLEQTLGTRIILISSGEVTFHLNDPNYVMVDRLGVGSFFGNSFVNSRSSIPYILLNATGSLKSISIEYLLEVLGKKIDLDSLVEEPYLKLNFAKVYFDFTNFETRTKLNCHSVETATVAELLGGNFPLHKMKIVGDDFQGISASIFHALLYLKRDISLDSIKASVVFDVLRMSASTIGAIFFEHGVETVSVKFTADALDEFDSPFVFFHGNNLIFCFGKFNGGFLVLDPLSGFKMLKSSDFNSLEWTGEIILLRLNIFHDFKAIETINLQGSKTEIDKAKIKNVTNIITKIVLSDRMFLLKVFFTSLLIFGIDILVPKVSEYLLDEVLKTADMRTLGSLVLLMVMLYAASVILNYFRTFFINSWGLKFNDKFTTSLVGVIFSKKTFSGKKLKIGEVFKRFSEIDEVRNFFGPETITTGINFFSIIAYIIILFSYSFKIALIPIVFLLLILAFQFYIKKKMRGIHHNIFELGSKKQSFLSEIISSMATVKAFNYEKKLSTDWDENLAETSKQERSLVSLGAISLSVTTFLNELLYLVAMWLGVSLLIDGKADFSPGEIFAISQYLQKVTGPLNGLVGFFTQYEDVKVSISKMAELIPFTNNSEKKIKQSIRLTGKIRLNNVFFKYSPTENHTLRNINLTIYPNQRVGIVGPSGSGKTTLANIIAGIERPTSGQILYDGVEADSIFESSLKSQIGYIRQQNDLLSGSIESNIAFTDSSPGQASLDRAAYLSGCTMFIEDFPQKLKTELAEGGIGLSGGQKQRVAIARSLYMDPKILIFDEATSALDSESESFLLSKIEELARTKTTIIIAHRLSTVRKSDLILCIDNGEIVQAGSHAELIAVEGLYRDLFLDQVDEG
jgi:ABC-type bacteriocin/lantibiotic exporter with double-glycine peptidase domain